MFKKEKRPLSGRNKKAAQFLILIGIVILPVFVLTGCKSFTCTWCGSPNTYTPLCASGTEYDVDYSSCIGPAAIFNCGLSTCIWPTECMTVSFVPGDGSEVVKGSVCYYDSFGCIDGENSMSNGSYSTSLNCGACGTCGFCGFCGSCINYGVCSDYRENVYSDSTIANQGIGCAKTTVDPRNYNNSLPRQYASGCCGVICGKE